MRGGVEHNNKHYGSLSLLSKNINKNIIDLQWYIKFIFLTREFGIASQVVISDCWNVFFNESVMCKHTIVTVWTRGDTQRESVLAKFVDFIFREVADYQSQVNDPNREAK